jgi:hypothetical protein
MKAMSLPGTHADSCGVGDVSWFRTALLPLLALVVALSGCAAAPKLTTTGAPSSMATLPASGAPASAATLPASGAPSSAATLPASGAPSSTATPSSAATAQAARGDIGRNGSAAWTVTPQGVYLSADAGRHFTQVPLPPGVAPAAVAAAASDVGGGHSWLAAGGPGRSITVHALNSATGQWSAGAELTPAWPPNLGGAEAFPPSAVWIIPGQAGQVLVMTELQQTHSVAIPRMFVSADGGVTYTQRVFPATSDLNTPWSAIAISGTNAVGVIGERQTQVVHSSDGAATWAPASLHGVTSGAAFAFVVGTPVFSGATVYLPVTESAAGGSGAFILLRSTDGGATFDADGAQTLSLGGPYLEGPTPAAAAGASWWLASPMTGSVYRSTDNGLSWSKAPAVLPQDVGDIGATDSQNATVTVSHNVCATGKTNCSSDQYFETTSDGGQTWTRI